jgi:hypothetical protein
MYHIRTTTFIRKTCLKQTQHTYRAAAAAIDFLGFPGHDFIFETLVGGTGTILKNMSSSMGRMTSHIYIMEKNKSLKPPTRNSSEPDFEHSLHDQCNSENQLGRTSLIPTQALVEIMQLLVPGRAPTGEAGEFGRNWDVLQRHQQLMGPSESTCRADKDLCHPSINDSRNGQPISCRSFSLENRGGSI